MSFAQKMASLAIATPLALLFAALVSPTQRSNAAPPVDSPSGNLKAFSDNGTPVGFCPLKHTEVEANVTGPASRVRLVQQFVNPYSRPIEAVYTFPLPANAAVDSMTMLVGDRRIQGQIKRREEAEQIFNQARQQGHLASKLDQERPNIFTQAVTNIQPGEQIRIEITYLELLTYDNGSYQFVFPMVVGPRYMPGNSTGKSGTGWSPDTDQVIDASKISPRVAKTDTRAGQDISLTVNLAAGVPFESLQNSTHEIEVERRSVSSAKISLKNQNEIPNRDFILKWTVAGKKVEDAILHHSDERGGFFSLLLTPPQRPTSKEITPKELVFVLDTSGSMSGFPMEKAKEAMSAAIEGLNPKDTFNLITFAGQTHVLFPKPVAATREHLAKAQQFLNGVYGSGGTEMMKAIRIALQPSDSEEHVRVVCFMTDGYVGNDQEVINEVKRHPNARVFSFGIGSSVNRFLLDRMAVEGRGEVEYVGLRDDGSRAAKRFHERIQSPILTDIGLDWNGLEVSDVYPQRLPDLFAAKPLLVQGRFASARKGTLRLTGRQAGVYFERSIEVDFSAATSQQEALAPMWARAKVEDLMSQDLMGLQQGRPATETKEQVTKLGLDFHLMTPFTSFVAVEERKAKDGKGLPVLVPVPVELPQGVNHAGIFRDASSSQTIMVNSTSLAMAPMSVSPMPASPSRTRADSKKSETLALDSSSLPSIVEVQPESNVKLHANLAKALSKKQWSKQGVAIKIHLIPNSNSASVMALLANPMLTKANSAPTVKSPVLIHATVSRETLEQLLLLAEVMFVEPQ
jgi:Ca-activated chloride channel homolog